MRLVVVLLAFAALGTSPGLQTTRYWDLATFRAMRALAPEARGARPAGLAPFGYELWERGELRLPETPATTLVGDFTGDGRPDRAVLLETGEPGGLRFWILVATRRDGEWTRLLLEPFSSGPAGSLVWDEARRTLDVDTGGRRRKGRPATMTWTPTGEGASQPGYVIEEWRVVPFVWSKKARAFRRGEPYWFRPP